MFWRRKTNDASSSSSSSRRAKQQTATNENDDELTKLQRQFGIKPVSDADVQAEFRSLFGGGSGGAAAGSSATGLSPRSEVLLFGGSGAHADDDDDDEASILRALNLTGTNVDQIDMDALSDDSDDDVHNANERNAAKRELSHVLRDAHSTATQNERKRDPLYEPPPPQSTPQPLNAAVAAQVRELKLAALARKRDGDVKAALALLRQAKELEAAQTHSAPPPPTTVHVAVSSYTVASPIDVDGHADTDDAVDVTDADMQNPEYLAQLAAMGLDTSDDDASSHSTIDPLVVLDAKIQDAKQRAVQHKRANEIALALQWLRTARTFEHERAAITAEKTRATTARATTVEVAHVYTAAAPPTTSDDVKDVDESDAEDAAIDVTDADMDDPAFAAELATLNTDASSSSSSSVERTNSAVAVQTTVQTRTTTLQTSYSIDDDDLIDAFDDSDSDDDDDSNVQRAGASEYVTLAAAPPPLSSSASTSSITIEDLTTQLAQAKALALDRKRSGNLQGALNAMRHMKQLENQLTQQSPVQTAAAQIVAIDPVAQATFHQLETLLVDMGNKALARAKELLAVDRTQATVWLNKRKAYAAALETLREKRKNPLQRPPAFRLEHTTQHVDVEHVDVALHDVVVIIHAIHDLRAAAGRDVHVRFCLNFPSTAPHDGRTNAMRVSATPPHSVSSSSSLFTFGLQRSRGTQRLFEIKKAQFEVWTTGTFLRSAEMLARGYLELAPLLSSCEVRSRVPFVGTNRKPTGGDVDVTIRLRTPLRDKETRIEIMDELQIDAYPAPLALPRTTAAAAAVVTQSTVTTTATTSSRETRAESVPASVASSVSAPTAVTVRASSAQQMVQKQPPRAAVSVASAPVIDVDDDPHAVDFIISYDVINEELAQIEAKLSSLANAAAASTLRDRLESLLLKKQLLEIDMETGKLTLDMYVASLHQRIAADRRIMATLMKTGRRMDAARVLRRVKLMEKELEGADEDGDGDVDEGA